MNNRLTIAFLCFALSACGGGSQSSLPTTLARGTAPAAPTKSTTSIAISIAIPLGTGTASTRRRPMYISQNTQSAKIAINAATPVVVNLNATSPNCTTTSGTRTCTMSVSAPVGVDTFAETLYSGVNGTGAVLSQGTTSATIVASKANTVALTLDGVVAALSVSLASPAPTEGTATTIGLVVNINDAGGASIIGNDPFVTPVTLADSDGTGATTLSKSTLRSPADAALLTIGYTGATIAPATITATAGAGVTASATLTPQAPAPSAFNDYSTFGYDNQRDVYNPNSTSLTPSSLSNLHLAWQASLNDYNTQTQPTLATEISGHAGVIFVGGGSGNVYAYDALSGALLWTRATGQEIYTCENSSTIYFGVGGTAAYDPSSKSLYVVGNTNNTPNAIAVNALFHLDGATGSVLGQTNFAQPDGVTSLDFSHTSVTLNNGLAYVGTGATCDISSWRGRVAAVSVPNMALANTFYTVWDPNNSRGNGPQPWGGGGIWGWGGVALNFDGSVLTGVGNTDDGTTAHGSIKPPFVAASNEYSGYGEALLKLSPDLTRVEDANHPIPQAMYGGNSGDLDLQGTPTIFAPNGPGCDTMAALQAKSGTIYLYDSTRIGAGTVGQFQLAPSTWSDGFLGGPAYSPATGLLYVAVSSSNESLYPPGMVAIDPGCGRPSIAWHASFGPDSYSPGSVVSPGAPRSVPAVSAGGVVLVGTICTPSGAGCGATSGSAKLRGTAGATRKPLICCAPPGTGGGAVWALDASTGAVLNDGNPLIITSGPLRVPPTIDGDWVFILDNSGNLYALTLDPKYASISTKARSIDSRMLKQWEAPPKAPAP